MFAVCGKPWAVNTILYLFNVTSAELRTCLPQAFLGDLYFLPSHAYWYSIFAWVSSGYIHHLLDPARKAAKDQLKLIIYLQGNSKRVV